MSGRFTFPSLVEADGVDMACRERSGDDHLRQVVPRNTEAAERAPTVYSVVETSICSKALHPINRDSNAPLTDGRAMADSDSLL
jgi:hypothetical protein